MIKGKIIWVMAGAMAATSPLLSQDSLEGKSFVTEPAVRVSTETSSSYVFNGDRYRDPFIPLVGASGVFDVRRPVSEPTGPFNPEGAEVKGILKTSGGRWAVIRTIDGAAFMVKNGDVFDPKRKQVKGYRGIVKDKSVVVFGPNNKEVELRLKKDEEEASVPTPK